MSLVVGYDISLPTPQTYTGLQSMVASWLNRSDLTALIPDFITLAEERLNRVLRVRQMEVDLAETEIASGVIAVPVGTLAVKSLWVSGLDRKPLHSQSFDFVKSRGIEGVPSVYAWQGTSFHFDGAGSVEGVLYERIPTLTAEVDTNWLLTEAPSAYLYAALREAFDYIRNDSERDRWAMRLDSVLNELNGVEKRDAHSGPLQVRAR